MIEQDGVFILQSSEEIPDLPLEVVSATVIYPYGLKIVEWKGRRVWQPATAEDYRQSMAGRLGITPEEVDLSKSSPCVGGPLCDEMDCPPNHGCRRIWDPSLSLTYCECVPAE